MIRRVVTAVAVFLATCLACVVPAGAHVGVSGDNAEPGGFATITFRVPNEESDASTVGLKIQLPPDHPIAFVSVQPKPGWTVKSTTAKLDTPIEAHGNTITEAVSHVEWTGGTIGPGEFDEFKIQAGPLPEGVDSLTFKAIQTYRATDGTTEEVAWIQEAGPGQPEPDKPAPVLQLTGSAAGNTGAGADASTGSAQAPAADADAASSGRAATTKNESSSSDSSNVGIYAMAFGVAALVMAIVAMILAVAARQKVTMTLRDAPVPGGDPDN